MQRFIKISNTIFTYRLSPKALFVYTYLLSRSSKWSYAKSKLSTISTACNMSVKTVCSAISELEQNDLIVKEHCFRSKKYITNSYKVTMLNNNHWFKLDTYIFKTSIPSTDFMIYCYIISKMSEDNMRAFPSLSLISQDTNISRGRVCKSIKFLQQYTYLNYVKRHYKRTRAYRHNKYLHFICNTGVQNKKRTQPNLHRYILPFNKNRGSTQITKPYIYPHFISNKRLNI